MNLLANRQPIVYNNFMTPDPAPAILELNPAPPLVDDPTPPTPAAAQRADLAGELDPAELTFINHYILHSSPRAAAIAAGYNEKYGSAVLAKPKIQAALKERFEELRKKNEINIQGILARLNRVASAAEDTGRYADSIRALELLGKYLGMFIDRNETKLRLTGTVLTGEALDSEIERLFGLVFNGAKPTP